MWMKNEGENDSRHWSGEILNLQAGVPPADLCSRLFRHLQRNGFNVILGQLHFQTCCSFVHPLGAMSSDGPWHVYVIANSKYQGKWTILQGAQEDLEVIQHACEHFVRLADDPIIVEDATYDAMSHLIEKILQLPQGSKVLLTFVGHGVETCKGTCFVPVDSRDKADGESFILVEDIVQRFRQHVMDGVLAVVGGCCRDFSDVMPSKMKRKLGEASAKSLADIVLYACAKGRRILDLSEQRPLPWPHDLRKCSHLVCDFWFALLLSIYRPMPLRDLFHFVEQHLGLARVGDESWKAMVQCPVVDGGYWRDRTAEKHTYLTRLPDGLTLKKPGRVDASGILPDETLRDLENDGNGPVDFAAFWGGIKVRAERDAESELLELASLLEEMHLLYAKNRKDQMVSRMKQKDRLKNEALSGPLRALTLTWLVPYGNPDDDEIRTYLVALVQTLYLYELDSFLEAGALAAIGLYLRRAQTAEDLNNANHLLSRAGTIHRKCHLRVISMGNCVSAVGCRMKSAKCPHGIVEVNKGLAALKPLALEIPDQHFTKRFLLEMDVLTLLTMEIGASLVEHAQNGSCVCGGPATSPDPICHLERLENVSDDWSIFQAAAPEAAARIQHRPATFRFAILPSAFYCHSPFAMVPQVALLFAALVPVAWADPFADPSCAVHGLAFSQENMAKTPNGAFLSGASSCQTSCSLTLYCQHFTWYKDSMACWLFGDKATLNVTNGNATSGPRSCLATEETVTPEPVVAPLKEQLDKVIKKVSHLASAIKEKTTDPNITLNADKVIRAAQIGTLPDSEAVYSVLNKASEVVPLEEAQKEGFVITAGDLDVIAKAEHRGGLEAAEEGVSYGVGTPWKDAVVPYCFRPGIMRTSMENVQRAIAQIQHMVPGIQFKLLGTKGEACEESPSIMATDTQQGCFSEIGMKTQFLGGSQTLNVPPVCTVGVVIHELLHALGMAHEQARPDRDQYVRVVWNNVRPGMESQFSVMGNADTARPYDLTSIMHYGQTSFTRNGQPTLVLTSLGQASMRSSGATFVGQRESMSQMDFEQLVHLYNCHMDDRGRYSECSPTSGSNLLVILLGVFGAVALCGCGLAVFCFCKRGRKTMPGEVRPLIRNDRAVVYR
eukprot:s30_g8.t1